MYGKMESAEVKECGCQRGVINYSGGQGGHMVQSRN